MVTEYKHLVIGFVIPESFTVPAWYAATIMEAAQLSFVRIFFITGNDPAQNRASRMYALFQKFEQSWFQSDDDAVALKKISELSLANTLFIEANDPETIKAQDPDLIYSVYETERDYKEQARFGFWYTEFGIAKYGRGQPEAFWEVMNQEAVTGSALIACYNKQRLMVQTGSTRTIPYSVKNNFNSIAWKTASYLAPLLKRLAANPETLFNSAKEEQPVAAPHQIPGDAAMSLLFTRNNLRYLTYKIQSNLPQARFQLFYTQGAFDPQAICKTTFTPVEQPKEFFYADPFVVKVEETNYLFFESFDDAKDKAHIAMIEERNGRRSAPRTVLDRPFHLSYPFVFEYEGSFYMIPETAANRTVELYKATSFPDEWEWQMNLMDDILLVDVTLHFANGKWWLFGSSHKYPFTSMNDHLFLFYSDDLFTTFWTPHIQNPIATHAANCRPAGRIFRYKEKWYRPAQNNASQQYGYGLKINEIVTLNEEEYLEKEILDIRPEPLGLKAIHHLSFTDDLILIDGIKA